MAQVRTYTFDIPIGTGNADLVIPAWNFTPKAAKFVLIRTDATDGYDDHSGIAIGFTDGITDACVGGCGENGVGTSNAMAWHNETNCIHGYNPSSQSSEIAASFVSWKLGGVRLNFSAVDATYKIIATFFAGSDVQAHVGTYEMSEHVEDVGFTSKLIFAVNSRFDTAGGFGIMDGHRLTCGFATNGSGGLRQNTIRGNEDDGSGTTNSWSHYVYSRIGESSGLYVAITDIDSSGFKLDLGSSTNLITILALAFDNDVDTSQDTVPTSGSISISTDPSFTPQIAGILCSNNVTSYSYDRPLGFRIGEVDDVSEHSAGIEVADGVSTSNNTSTFYENILHTEDADQVVLSDGDFDAFTASGFDITVNTNPTAVQVFLWWAIEESDESDERRIFNI